MSNNIGCTPAEVNNMQNSNTKTENALETETADARIDRLRNGEELTVGRIVNLKRAIELGADDALLLLIISAIRASQGTTILISTRYAHLSRGKCWGRLGSGANVTWAERDGSKVILGPGKWVVGSDNGFSCREQVRWKVEHVKVGNEIWTLAF